MSSDMGIKCISLTSAACVAVLAFTAPANCRAQNLFVSNQGSGTISEISPEGTVTTFASGLSNPNGLAFNSSGDLFVANENVGTISEIAPDGSVSLFASGLSDPYGLAFNGS